MTSTFRCDDKDTLVAYLYDEIDAESRRQVAAHLRSCAACASEVAALRHVRENLAAWQPPEPQLDFAIVQNRANVLRPARWLPPALPAWAQVAAAVLVLAAGAALANVQVRYGGDGLTVSTGWMAPRTPNPDARQPLEAASPQARSPVSTPGQIGVESRAVDDWRPALAALESTLRRELQMVRASTTSPARVRTEAADSVDDAAVMRRVQALLEESEQRQRRELALRMTQFSRDIDMQRRSDLVRISQDLGYLRGRTNTMEGSQRQMVDILRRVSTTPVP